MHGSNIIPMESRLGHSNMMMFLCKCIGKKQHQKTTQKSHFSLSKLMWVLLLMFFYLYIPIETSSYWFVPSGLPYIPLYNRKIMIKTPMLYFMGSTLISFRLKYLYGI